MISANLLGALDGPDLLIVLAIVLLLFGGAKLPHLARSLGEAKREFHKATTDETPAPSPPTPTSTSATDNETAQDNLVMVDRAELDRLRALAAHQPPKN